MAVTYLGAQQIGFGYNVTSKSLTCAVPSTTNLAVVAIGGRDDYGTVAQMSITLGGQAMTRLCGTDAIYSWLSIYYLVDPPTGTQTLSASWALSVNTGNMCITYLSGANPGDPFRMYAGDETPPLHDYYTNVESTDYVLDFMQYTYTNSGGVSPPNPTVDWGTVYINSAMTNGCRLKGTRGTGTGSITVSWSAGARSFGVVIQPLVLHDAEADVSVGSDITMIAGVTHQILDAESNAAIESEINILSNVTHQTIDAESNVTVTSEINIRGNAMHQISDAKSNIAVTSEIDIFSYITHQIIDAESDLLISSNLQSFGDVSHQIIDAKADILIASELIVNSNVIHQIINGNANPAVSSSLEIIGNVLHQVIDGSSDLLAESVLYSSGNVLHQSLNGEMNASIESKVLADGFIIHQTLDAVANVVVSSEIIASGKKAATVISGEVNLTVSSEMIITTQVVPFDVAPDERTIKIMQESRTVRIPHDVRTIDIMRENRVFKITSND